MSAVAAPSPRTADEPMAFTPDEVFTGVGMAWVVFVVIVLVVLTGGSLYGTLTAVGLGASDSSMWSTLLFVLIIGIVVGGGVSLIVALLMLPLAWWISRLMRRVRFVGWHLAVYGAFGAAIGVLAVVVYVVSWGYPPSGEYLLNWFTLLVVFATTASVLIGWRWGARRALQECRPDDSRIPVSIDRALDESR